MANITVGEAQAWLEHTRANLGTTLDAELESSVATQVLARVGLSYDVSTWTTPETTPKLVRKIIAMKFAAWYYQREYSEDADTTNEYALLLNANAESLLDGVVSGALALDDLDLDSTTRLGTPAYELPTEASFTMGKVW